jgi:pimeloyl-ACP methyl ester carboxylesterase
MRVPIIFIPGIMGSRLVLPGGSNWDPDDSLNMLEWAHRHPEDKSHNLVVANIAWAPSFQTFSVSATIDLEIKEKDPTFLGNAAAAHTSIMELYSARGWAGVSWQFYGLALCLLETTFNSADGSLAGSNPVYAFSYDWRQPNQANGIKLAAYVDQVLGHEFSATKVALVTHSMGGLVARAATLLPGLSAKVTGVVHSAQPSNGAVVAYRRYQTGCNCLWDGFGVASQVMENILGTSPEDYAVTSSGIPSVFELLPNDRFSQFSVKPWLITQPATDQTNVYDSYKRSGAPGIIPPNIKGRIVKLLEKIDRARDFHQTLNDSGFAHTYVLYGDGCTTDERVDYTVTLPSQRFVQSATGDGTVPQSSGSCPGLRAGYVQDSFVVHKVDHAGMFQDATHNTQLLKYVQKLLN